jgi:hypothetical protein
VQVERKHQVAWKKEKKINVRTLSANIKKKGIFPVHLNRFVGLGKGKKGNYP